MTPSEKKAYEMMNSVDNFETPSRISGVSQGVGLTAMAGSGNKSYKAQVDISVKQVVSEHYFAIDECTNGNKLAIYQGGTPTVLPVSLQTKAPVILFGYSDFYGGYNKAAQLLPSINFALADIILVNASVEGFDVKDATAYNYRLKSYAVQNGLAQKGDMIIVEFALKSQTADETIFYVREIIISCKQVAYGTLLNSIASDIFSFNAIKYFVADPSKINQFTNELTFISQSLFGKTTNDTVNPNSFLSAMQQVANVREIDLEQGIDKAKSLCTYLNYDCLEIQLSFFIPLINKR